MTEKLGTRYEKDDAKKLLLLELEDLALKIGGEEWLDGNTPQVSIARSALYPLPVSESSDIKPLAEECTYSFSVSRPKSKKKKNSRVQYDVHYSHEIPVPLSSFPAGIQLTILNDLIANSPENFTIINSEIDETAELEHGDEHYGLYLTVADTIVMDPESYLHLTQKHEVTFTIDSKTGEIEYQTGYAYCVDGFEVDGIEYDSADTPVRSVLHAKKLDGNAKEFGTQAYSINEQMGGEGVLVEREFDRILDESWPDRTRSMQDETEMILHIRGLLQVFR